MSWVMSLRCEDILILQGIPGYYALWGERESVPPQENVRGGEPGAAAAVNAVVAAGAGWVKEGRKASSQFIVERRPLICNPHKYIHSATN